MISFIIIGRNEGWKISLAVESVHKTIKVNHLADAEVVYVDSSSTDDSVSRVQKIGNTRILILNKNFNAALARNAGANHSSGDWMAFIDGDMEFNPEFIPEFMKLENQGHEFISGQLLNYYYDDQWNLLKEENLFMPNKLNTHDVTNGGAFMIKRELWDRVRGMRSQYDFSQDIDLNYRLARTGNKIWRSDVVYSSHHTLQYNYDNKLRKGRINAKRLLYRGVLLRDHLFNPTIVRRVIRINYSLIALLASVLLAIIIHPIVLLVYPAVLLGRSAKNYISFRSVIRTSYFSVLIKYLSIDLLALAGFLFFFPGKKKSEVIEITEAL